MYFSKMIAMQIPIHTLKKHILIEHLLNPTSIKELIPELSGKYLRISEYEKAHPANVLVTKATRLAEETDMSLAPLIFNVRLPA